MRQLNQPGWVYTWTFIGFSITRQDVSSRDVLCYYCTVNVEASTGARLVRLRYHTLVGKGLTRQENAHDNKLYGRRPGNMTSMSWV